jgi:hypothetical protein
MRWHHEQLPQFLFGAMVSRAKGTIESYHSDLYHDALEICARYGGRKPACPKSFLFGYGKTGTWLTDNTAAYRHAIVGYFDHCLTIEVHPADRHGYHEVLIHEGAFDVQD